jgi:hypothetical protein
MDFKNYRVKSISCTGIDKYRFRANAYAHDNAVRAEATKEIIDESNY